MRFMRFFVKAGNYQKIREYLFEVSAMEEELHEFPVIDEEKNEVVTLFLSKDMIDKVTKNTIELKYKIINL